jgi:hypothetical protein
MSQTHVDSGKDDGRQHVGRIGNQVQWRQRLPVKGVQLERIGRLDRVDLDTPVLEHDLRGRRS